MKFTVVDYGKATERKFFCHDIIIQVFALSVRAWFTAAGLDEPCNTDEMPAYEPGTMNEEPGLPEVETWSQLGRIMQYVRS